MRFFELWHQTSPPWLLILTLKYSDKQQVAHFLFHIAEDTVESWHSSVVDTTETSLCHWHCYVNRIETPPSSRVVDTAESRLSSVICTIESKLSSVCDTTDSVAMYPCIHPKWQVAHFLFHIAEDNVESWHSSVVDTTETSMCHWHCYVNRIESPSSPRVVDTAKSRLSSVICTVESKLSSVCDTTESLAMYPCASGLVSTFIWLHILMFWQFYHLHMAMYPHTHCCSSTYMWSCIYVYMSIHQQSDLNLLDLHVKWSPPIQLS